MRDNMEITDLNCDEFLSKAELPVMLVYRADFCGPSAALEPYTDQIVVEYGSRLLVVEIDVEKMTGITRKYLVKQTPTMMLFIKGEPVATRMGTASMKTLRSWLEQYIP